MNLPATLGCLGTCLAQDPWTLARWRLSDITSIEVGRWQMDMNYILDNSVASIACFNYVRLINLTE